MSPDEPIEEKALAAIADILSNLTGWPYPRTPTVDRIIPPPASQMDSDTLPRIFVSPGRGSNLFDDAGISPTVRLYKHALNVDIHGVVEADADTLADTWRWRLRQDILAVLHLHLSLYGLARSIDFSTKRAEDLDFGEMAPKAWFMQPITVSLREEYPTAA